MLPNTRNRLTKIMVGKKILNKLKIILAELTLIVVGILIAVQINDWDQNRIETNKGTKLMRILLNDLYDAKLKSIEIINLEETDFDYLKLFISSEEQRDLLLNHPKVDSIFFKMIFYSIQTKVPVINSYEDMKSSGQTGLITNDSIRFYFTAMESSLNDLKISAEDRLTVQQINFDSYVINNMNVAHLLNWDSDIEVKEFGIKNNYRLLFKDQFVLNAIAVKANMMERGIKDRKVLLNKIESLILFIEEELKTR